MKSASARALLLFVGLSLTFLTSTGCSQNSERVSKEEYKVYSAFLNESYLAGFNNTWFTIGGVRSRTFSHIDRIERVVIYSQIIPDTTNGYSRFRDVQDTDKLPPKLFEDFLKTNDSYTQLSNRFKVNVQHDLIPIDTLNKVGAAAIEKKVAFGVEFVSRYPKAPGIIGFFRAAFARDKTKALFGVLMWHVTNPATDQFTPSNQLVLMSKTRSGWKVDRLFPGDGRVRVDLRACRPIQQQYWLPLGSTYFEVVGREKDNCRVREFYEEEGGATTTDCLVPVSVNDLIAQGRYPFVYSVDLSGYCEQPKQGSIFLNQLLQRN